MAYPFTIDGRILVPPTLDIAPFSLPIYIYPKGDSVKRIVYADAGYQYHAEFEIANDENVIFVVEVMDVCTGELMQQTVESVDGEAVVNFRICSNNEECPAWFSHKIDSTTVTFKDESELEILSYLWDFGDGNESMEDTPQHTYREEGNYDVTLQILTIDSCQSRVVQNIWVGSSCACPEYFFEVCAMDDEGNIKRFDNPCFAACEGFDILISCDDSCSCTDTLSPVCIEIGGGIATIKNACEARCLGIDYFDCRANCICPDIYDPVCVATPSGQILTFGNACLAECAGYKDISFPCPDSCVCPLIYDPVCVLGEDSNIVRFPNACEANCAGFFDFVACDTNFFCPLIYDPVCVTTVDGEMLTFGNQCFAELAGFGELARPCPDTSCACPFILDPVCVLLDNGAKMEFPNACVANCAGYFEFVVCDTSCICPDVYAPVCVVTDEGEFLKFGNACEAACEGFFDIMDCDTSCICPAVFDPVCVLTEDGKVIRFGNACEAECQGYTSFVDCQPECYCFSDHFAPVCVTLDDGTVLTFVNDCFAMCAGYSEYDSCAIDTTCGCDDVFDPVCVADDNGNRIEFPNACYAECAGYTDFRSCSITDCPCSREFDPVCTIDLTTGEIKRFDNPCLAECAGYVEFVDCDLGCDCPDVYDPVCYTIVEGIRIVFDNRCIADCIGISALGLDTCATQEEGGDQSNTPQGLQADKDLDAHKGFRVFPNPSTSDITIQLNSKRFLPEQTTLSILDQNGTLVIQRKFDSLNWESGQEIYTRNLPAGIYFIRLDSKLDTDVQTFIKQ